MSNPNPVTKWKPGQLINPNGRPPKELAMTQALKDILSEKDPVTKIERYKLLLDKALQMAMRGDGDMLKYLINRIDGMPKLSTDITSGGEPIEFKVVLTEENGDNPSR